MRIVFILLLVLCFVSTVNAAELFLSWTDNSSDETSFDLQRATSYGGTYTTIATLSAGTTSYRDTNLIAGQEYCYKIAACNAGGCSSYIGPVCQRPVILPEGEFR